MCPSSPDESLSLLFFCCAVWIFLERRGRGRFLPGSRRQSRAPLESSNSSRNPHVAPSSVVDSVDSLVSSFLSNLGSFEREEEDGCFHGNCERYMAASTRFSHRSSICTIDMIVKAAITRREEGADHSLSSQFKVTRADHRSRSQKAAEEEDSADSFFRKWRTRWGCRGRRRRESYWGRHASDADRRTGPALPNGLASDAPKMASIVWMSLERKGNSSHVRLLLCLSQSLLLRLPLRLHPLYLLVLSLLRPIRRSRVVFSLQTQPLPLPMRLPLRLKSLLSAPPQQSLLLFSFPLLRRKRSS